MTVALSTKIAAMKKSRNKWAAITIVVASLVVIWFVLPEWITSGFHFNVH